MKQDLQAKDKLSALLLAFLWPAGLAREDLEKNFELQSLEIIQLSEELQHFQEAPEAAKTMTPKKPSAVQDKANTFLISKAQYSNNF
jgi:hypothetical protein